MAKHGNRFPIQIAALFLLLNCPGSISWADEQSAILVTSSPSNGQGVALYKNGQFQAAVQKFEQAYQRNEDPSSACYNLALCYQKLGDVARARQYFDFILQTFPGTSVATLAASRLGRAQTGQTENSPINETIGYTAGPWHFIIVSALLNGKPIPMLFDTGAACSMATRSQLSRFGIDLNAQRSHARVYGAGGLADADTAGVTVQVGNVARRLNLLIQDDKTLQLNQGRLATFGYPLLGQDFFKDYAYEIDTDDCKISFRSPASSLPKGGDYVPFRFEGNHIIVTSKIGGRDVDMILDTGAASIAITDKQMASYGISRPAGFARGYTVGVGGKRDAYPFTIDQVLLGPIERRGVEAAVAVDSTFPQPLLGMSFLQGLRFTVEPRLHAITLAPRRF